MQCLRGVGLGVRGVTSGDIRNYITSYSLHVAHGNPIFDWQLEFCNAQNGKFQFTDQTNDSYGVKCYVLGVHGVNYNSKKPQIKMFFLASSSTDAFVPPSRQRCSDPPILAIGIVEFLIWDEVVEANEESLVFPANPFALRDVDLFAVRHEGAGTPSYQPPILGVVGTLDLTNLAKQYLHTIHIIALDEEFRDAF
ncbi:hypothetical protein MSAN_01190000 [Mycena sanguinolenta]|uniref:Uncharacterized protein n=1 Tax=Mycena sanguinolenta TaxID=230812 RepID=A0A8H6YMT0_9AGAR|nr:hypothetical protein MSAN_01190000 [Mycena sanguinolenta]